MFLIVLIRNLLFVPARGHFIQPIGPIVSARVFPRFASFNNSSMAFLCSPEDAGLVSVCCSIDFSRNYCFFQRPSCSLQLRVAISHLGR